MKKVLFLMLSMCAVSFAQSKAEGGYIMRDPVGAYSTWSQEQALNSIADWYTVKQADSTATKVFSTKYGSTYRCKQIRNNTGSTRFYKIYFVNKVTDTVTLTLGAQETSGKLPAIKGVISGAVADSTLYFFQIN